MDRYQQLLKALDNYSTRDLIDYWTTYHSEDIMADLKRLSKQEVAADADADLKAFTKAAMQGLCANSAFDGPVGVDQTPEEIVAQAAIRIARATLTELSKQQ